MTRFLVSDRFVFEVAICDSKYLNIITPVLQQKVPDSNMIDAILIISSITRNNLRGIIYFLFSLFIPPLLDYVLTHHDSISYQSQIIPAFSKCLLSILVAINPPIQARITVITPKPTTHETLK